MEYYYGIMFIVIAAFQEHVEGFVVSLTCSIVGFLSSYLTLYLVAQDYNFYYAVMLIDLGMVIVAVNVLSHKIGKVLFIASTLSLLFNIFMWFNFTPATALVYNTVKPFYTTINIIIFEILLYSCLLQSKIYPWVKIRFDKLAFKYLPKSYLKFIKREKQL